MLFIYLLACCWGWTQYLPHTRQVFYNWDSPPAQFPGFEARRKREVLLLIWNWEVTPGLIIGKDSQGVVGLKFMLIYRFGTYRIEDCYPDSNFVTMSGSRYLKLSPFLGFLIFVNDSFILLIIPNTWETSLFLTFYKHSCLIH